jgi:rhodanese-related sulfurtransferase
MASHQAAGRAVEAGYKNVSVMADGLMGWKAAGEPVAHPS